MGSGDVATLAEELKEFDPLAQRRFIISGDTIISPTIEAILPERKWNRL
jgi:hypothetical protein